MTTNQCWSLVGMLRHARLGDTICCRIRHITRTERRQTGRGRIDPIASRTRIALWRQARALLLRVLVLVVRVLYKSKASQVSGTLAGKVPDQNSPNEARTVASGLGMDAVCGVGVCLPSIYSLL